MRLGSRREMGAKGSCGRGNPFLVTESRNPKDLWTPEGWRPVVDKQRKWRHLPAFKLPSCKWRGKTANQGTKNPARVFHTTKISIASVPKPNETSWNHALHNLENGHADSKALKHLLEYALSFFYWLSRLCSNQEKCNTTWLEFEAN